MVRAIGEGRAPGLGFSLFAFESSLGVASGCGSVGGPTKGRVVEPIAGWRLAGRRAVVLTTVVLLMGSVRMPAAMAALDVTQVSAGGTQTCALTPAGAADCWGSNNYGESTDHAGSYTQISAGVSGYTCALTPTGAADCWGDNTWNQATDQAGPFTQISASYFHTCGLTPTGAADCWGDGSYGESADQAGPYTQIAAGKSHTCALTSGGAADCWGLDSAGQATDQVGTYTQITAGDYFTCALTPTGAADCWGSNFYGQAADRVGPYTQISAGAAHACGLTPSGGIDCWGDDSYGQAADAPGGFYTAVDGGLEHTCAITLTGSVACAGWSYAGKADSQKGPFGAALSIKAPKSVAKGSRVKITGSLSSFDDVCVASQEVFLKKGSSKTGPKITDAAGNYRFVVKITKKTTVHVTYAGAASCSRRVSAKKTIKVT